MLEKKLQKLYFYIISPAILLILLFFISEKIYFNFKFLPANRVINTAIMIFTAITSTILPVWYKLLLVKKYRNKKKVSKTDFNATQYRIIISISFSIYWIFPAYLYQSPEMPMLIISFFILYGLYYYYPSKKRIDAEKKIFKIDE